MMVVLLFLFLLLSNLLTEFSGLKVDPEGQRKITFLQCKELGAGRKSKTQILKHSKHSGVVASAAVL